MKTLRLKFLNAVAACLLVASTTQANLILNGSFEADVFNTSGGGYSLGLGISSPFTAWSVNSDTVYPWGLQNANIFGGGPTPYGNQWVVVYRNPGNNWIQQTVSGLTPGQQYDLKFSLASELFGGTGSEVNVSILGAGTLSATYQALPTPGNYWQRWNDHTFSFIADSATLTFRFDGGDANGSADTGIDNVSLVAAVPEPSTFIAGALLAFPFGVQGIRYLRNRKATA